MQKYLRVLLLHFGATALVAQPTHTGHAEYSWETAFYISCVSDLVLCDVTCRYSAFGKIQAGFIFLRPCKAVARHMLKLVTNDALLQFQYTNAEQDFFDWYFKYTRYSIPIEYNALPDRLDGNLTVGGVRPKVVHHTQIKPFKRIPNAPGHQFLCSK